MICVEDNFPGEKVSENFQDNDDLRLRQFCRRKIFWIFPRFWWFAAKTILQANKFLNIFRIMMICGEDNFAGKKVFECFQDKDDLRLRRFCRRISLSIFSENCWFAAKATLQATKSLNISGTLMICSYENFAGEKVIEFFQDNDGLRPRQFSRRKSLWIFSG